MRFTAQTAICDWMWKKKSRNLNPGLTAWVIMCNQGKPKFTNISRKNCIHKYTFRFCVDELVKSAELACVKSGAHVRCCVTCDCLWRVSIFQFFLAAPKLCIRCSLYITISLSNFVFPWVSIIWPCQPCCCERDLTTVINTSTSFHLRVGERREAKNNINYSWKKITWNQKGWLHSLKGARQSRTHALD